MMGQILELAQQLIKFQSLSYYEFPLVQFIAGWLDQKNLPYSLDVFDPTRFLQDNTERPDTANLYIDIGRGPQTLMLYAHSDVVDGPPELFRPQIKDDRLFGRGSVDMKSSLGGLMLAAEKYRAAIENSNKRIIFAIIADEETSGSGAQRHIEWLVQEKLGGDNLWCVLTEPTDNFAHIEVGGKGYIFIDLEGTLPEILAALKALLLTKKHLLAPYMDDRPEFGVPFISITSIKCTPEIITRQMITEAGRASHASRPHQGENALEKALLKMSGPIVNIDTGGNSPNVIPDSCTVYLGELETTVKSQATVDVRTNLIADRGDKLLGDLQDFFERQPGLSYRVRKRGKAYFTADDAPLLEICRRSVHPPPALRIAQGGSDVGYYATITPNVIGGFGPGENKLAHSDAESIALSTLMESQDVFSKLIEDFIN